MRISYHKDTDSLYIHLNASPTVESEEVADGTVVHFGKNGQITGIEVYTDASETVDLSSVELKGLGNRRAPNVKRRKVSGRLLSSNAPTGRATRRFRQLTDNERHRILLDKVAI